MKTSAIQTVPTSSLITVTGGSDPASSTPTYYQGISSTTTFGRIADGVHRCGCGGGVCTHTYRR